MRSLDFSIDLTLPAALWPWIEHSALREQTAQCVYNFPRESGRIYTAETAITLAVRLREHKQQKDKKVKISLLQAMEDHKVA
jgi:hypothetical protein